MPRKKKSAIERTDDELASSIGKLLTAKNAAETIAKALGVKDQDVSRVMRDQRRNLNLLLYAGLAPDLYAFTQRYYRLMDRVITAFEATDVETLPIRDLMKLSDTINRWIAPINQFVALAPGKEHDLPDGGGPRMSAQQINMLFAQMHDARAAIMSQPSPAASFHPTSPQHQYPEEVVPDDAPPVELSKQSEPSESSEDSPSHPSSSESHTNDGLAPVRGDYVARSKESEPPDDAHSVSRKPDEA